MSFCHAIFAIASSCIENARDHPRGPEPWTASLLVQTEKSLRAARQAAEEVHSPVHQFARSVTGNHHPAACRSTDTQAAKRCPARQCIVGAVTAAASFLNIPHCTTRAVRC